MSVQDKMKQITDLAESLVELGDHKTVHTINTSLIKWRTGVPKENGIYIVTYGYHENGVRYTTCLKRDGYYWYDFAGIDVIGIYHIIAWCPLSEIEPYKE